MKYEQENTPKSEMGKEEKKKNPFKKEGIKIQREEER